MPNFTVFKVFKNKGIAPPANGLEIELNSSLLAGDIRLIMIEKTQGIPKSLLTTKLPQYITYAPGNLSNVRIVKKKILLK